MPAIRKSNVAAGTANALSGEKFEEIPGGGALVTLYATTAAAGGTIDFSVGSEDFLKDAEINIEADPDVVDTDRDLVMNQEPVPAGKMFLAVNAQIANFLLIIE